MLNACIIFIMKCGHKLFHDDSSSFNFIWLIFTSMFFGQKFLSWKLTDRQIVLHLLANSLMIHRLLIFGRSVKVCSNHTKKETTIKKLRQNISFFHACLITCMIHRKYSIFFSSYGIVMLLGHCAKTKASKTKKRKTHFQRKLGFKM